MAVPFQEIDEVPNNIDSGDSTSSINGGLAASMKQEEMTESASRKHALSERKRRKRINNHYDSLRKFFPRLLKNDKASVLSETVRHIKELENMVTLISPSQEHKNWCPDVSQLSGAKDEVSVSYFEGCENTTVVRAVICCEDRMDLNHALMEAIRLVHGKVVKAEIAMMGGRTKVEVMVEWAECGDRGEVVGLLSGALKAVMEK